MLITKQDVRNVFHDLLTKMQRVTSLDVKNDLRAKGFTAFQTDVSQYMIQIADEDGIIFDDNGTYRTYYFAADNNGYLLSTLLKPSSPDQPTIATVGQYGIAVQLKEDKATMQDGEVRFHMEEDGSFGSIQFKKLCKECPESIVITVEGLGTPNAKASYVMTFKD